VGIRPSGRFYAEIRDSKTKERHWLGTYDTPNEARRAYDAAAIAIRGSPAYSYLNSSSNEMESNNHPLAGSSRSVGSCINASLCRKWMNHIVNKYS